MLACMKQYLTHDWPNGLGVAGGTTFDDAVSSIVSVQKVGNRATFLVETDSTAHCQAIITAAKRSSRTAYVTAWKQ